MDYAILRAELTTDPLTIGYAGMTDTQAAASLNTVNQTISRTNVPANDVLRAIVPADLTALTTNQLLELLILVLSAGTQGLDASNANIRGDFTAMFAGKNTTLNALNALQNTTVSRAFVLGLPTVLTLDVTIARSGKW